MACNRNCSGCNNNWNNGGRSGCSSCGTWNGWNGCGCNRYRCNGCGAWANSNGCIGCANWSPCNIASAVSTAVAAENNCNTCSCE